MLGNLMKTRQTRVDDLIVNVIKILEVMNNTEKACVLLLTSAQLATASEIYGKDFINLPQSNSKLSGTIVDEMLDIYKTALTVADTTPLNMARYVRIHIASILVFTATVAVGLNARKYRSKTSSLWKTIWLSKAHSDNALVWLRKSEIASGASCFPPINKRRMSDVEVQSFASHLPAFLVKKSKKTVS